MMRLYMSGTWSRRLDEVKLYMTAAGGADRPRKRKTYDQMAQDPTLVNAMKMRLLYAYPELCKKSNIPQLIPAYCDGVFLDSGAYSVYKSGKTVDIVAFVDFIKQHGHLFEVIASLDVIGDWQGSKKNYKYMLKHGVDVLPCFHYGEPVDLLDWYVSNTDYIGLGDITGIRKQQRRTFLDMVFCRYPDNTKVRFHGFGINDFSLLDQFPFYSVDSAAIVMCAINRQLKTDKGIFYVGAQLYEDKGVQYNDSVWEYVKQLSFQYLGGDYMDQLISEDVPTCVCFLVLLMYQIMVTKGFSSNYVYQPKKSKLSFRF